MNTMQTPRLDRNFLSVGSLHEESDEKAYWLSKTPIERLEALELMRQIHYGYDPATERLQRVIEIVDRKRQIGRTPSAPTEGFE